MSADHRHMAVRCIRKLPLVGIYILPMKGRLGQACESDARWRQDPLARCQHSHPSSGDGSHVILVQHLLHLTQGHHTHSHHPDTRCRIGRCRRRLIGGARVSVRFMSYFCTRGTISTRPPASPIPFHRRLLLHGPRHHLHPSRPRLLDRLLDSRPTLSLAPTHRPSTIVRLRRPVRWGMHNWPHAAQSGPHSKSGETDFFACERQAGGREERSCLPLPAHLNSRSAHERASMSC